MSEQYIFSIDNGTQSVRAMLFDTQGNLIAKGKEELDAYFSEQPGWAEQHPEYYWDSLKKACNKLWESVSIDRSKILAATVTTQRGTVVNVDKEGNSLRPAIIWLDQRRAEVEGSVPGLWKWLFKLAGVEDVVHRFREKSQAAWISQNQKELWKKTHKYLLLSGYLTFKLTGEYKDSIASQVGYIPFDYKKRAWAKDSDWRYRVAPELKKSMLPELFEPGEKLGQLTKAAAEHIGLFEGLPVIASASDKACEILGSGGNRPDIACMSYGTTATINTTNKKYVEPIKFIPAYSAAIPGAFSSEIMIYRGYWMVTWFKKEFGLREQHIADERGIEPEQLFDELVNQVPAGSMGLMLQPYYWLW
jgi:sugar (pentulose or hexulose) kinase